VGSGRGRASNAYAHRKKGERLVEQRGERGMAPVTRKSWVAVASGSRAGHVGQGGGTHFFARGGKESGGDVWNVIWIV